MKILKQDKHEPLRIEFNIRHGSPIREPSHIIHLDALLAYVAVERNKEAGATDFSAQEVLPLSKLTDNAEQSAPVWAASGLQYEPYLKEARYWSRKTDIEKVAQLQGQGFLRFRGTKIDTGSGAWKGYSEFELLHHTRKLVAYAVGDKAQIQDMLCDITHVGKRRSKGYGEVTSINVTHDETAYSEVSRRVLTWPESPGYIEMRCGVRPPYFSKEQGYYPSRAVFENNGG